MTVEILRLGASAVELRRLRLDPSYVCDPTLEAGARRDFWTGAVRWLTRHRERLRDIDCERILAWARHEFIERRSVADATERRGPRSGRWSIAGSAR